MKYLTLFLSFFIFNNILGQTASADYYNKAQNLRAKNKLIEAINYYDSAIIRNPTFLEALYYRGITFGYLKRDFDAFRDFDKVVKLNPSFKESYKYRGMSRDPHNLEELKLSNDDYSNHLRAYPNDSEIFFMRANNYGVLKDYLSALKDLNKAIELNSKNGDYYKMRGITIFNLGTSKFKIVPANIRKMACDDISKAQSLGVVVDDKIVSEICK